MDGSPDPEDPAGTMLPGSGPALPIRTTFLKATPVGILNLRVHVSGDPALDSAFAADGWDVVRAGPLSIRFRLET